MNRTLRTDRLEITADLFGNHFPLQIEPTIYAFAEQLSDTYTGGYWHFYTLDNGGFYMAPDQQSYPVISENGFTGRMSGEAFGITVCLYAYSHLSFSTNGTDMAECCARHFHWLREYALDHPEARAILAAVD